MVPIAFATLCFPVLYAVEHAWALRVELSVLPPAHPGVLVLLCSGAALICVPLYQAQHVYRLSLLGVLAFHAVFLHYLAAYAFLVGGRALGAVFGFLDLLLLVQLGCSALTEDVRGLRQTVWAFCSATGPLCMVPQVLALLALSA